MVFLNGKISGVVVSLVVNLYHDRARWISWCRKAKHVGRRVVIAGRHSRSNEQKKLKKSRHRLSVVSTRSDFL